MASDQRYRQVFLTRKPEGATVQLTYDPKRNIAYLRLREPNGAELETVRVSDEVNVDLAPDGLVYGIELLNANEQLAGGQFVLDWGAKRLEVPLPQPV